MPLRLKAAEVGSQVLKGGGQPARHVDDGSRHLIHAAAAAAAGGRAPRARGDAQGPGPLAGLVLFVRWGEVGTHTVTGVLPLAIARIDRAPYPAYGLNSTFTEPSTKPSSI